VLDSVEDADGAVDPIVDVGIPELCGATFVVETSTPSDGVLLDSGELVAELEVVLVGVSGLPCEEQRGTWSK
jgi:hypothetical protein